MNDLYNCTECYEYKKAKCFSKKQMKKNHKQVNQKKCIKCVKKISTKKNVQIRKCGRRRRNKKHKHRSTFEGCVDYGMRSSRCRKCITCGDAHTFPTLHEEGEHELSIEYIFAGDCPVQCWLCGLGNGKGAPLYQCPCDGSRRHLQNSVSCLEFCESFEYKNYEDLKSLFEEWLEVTGEVDAEGVKVGDIKQLLHFCSQQFCPKHKDMPYNLMLPLRHIGMGLVGDMMVYCDELLTIFDNKLKKKQVNIPEMEEYLNIVQKIKEKTKEMNPKISTKISLSTSIKSDSVISAKLSAIEKKKKEKKLKSQRKEFFQLEKQIKAFEKEIKILEKAAENTPGYYMILRRKSFVENGILESQGKLNKYTGNMATRVLRRRPHVHLFKPHKFTFLRNSKNRSLRLGSDDLFERINHWFNKTNQILSILWPSDSFCMHEIKQAELSLKSWWHLRSKNVPFKTPTWKEHRLKDHTMPQLHKRKSIGRFGEERIESNMQTVNKASKILISVNDPQQRLKSKIARCNKYVRSSMPQLDGKRKKCSICNCYVNRKLSPSCNCLKN